MNQFECQKSMGWTDNEWKLVSGVAKKNDFKMMENVFGFSILIRART